MLYHNIGLLLLPALGPDLPLVTRQLGIGLLLTYLRYLLSNLGDSMGILRMTGEGVSGVPVKRVRRAQQGFTLLVKLLVRELTDCLWL